MKTSLMIFSLVCCLAVLCGCSLKHRLEFNPDPGTRKIKTAETVMGAKRYFLLHVPPAVSPDEPLPLVVVVHGAFSTPKKMEKETGFSDLADREKFLVVYPSGAYGIFGFLKHWNAGHCCGKAAEDNLDDVGFLLDIITDVSAAFPVDQKRIYMTGFSNGGMLTHRFAAEHAAMLAAAAPLAAATGGRASADMPLWFPQQPGTSLPVVMFHGRADRSVPFDGGTSPAKGGEREYVSVDDSVRFWTESNQRESAPENEILRSGQVIKKAWIDPAGKADVVLYEIKGWGHQWPGPYFTDQLPASDPLKGFDATGMIWEFFKKHHR